MSGLLWSGTPHHLLAAIGQRSSIQLCSNSVLLEELRDVLTRPSAPKRLALIGKTAHQVLADYVHAIELVEPASVPRVVPLDADDDQVIAAAVAAHADLIVSGDRKHLLPLGKARSASPLKRAAHAAR